MELQNDNNYYMKEYYNTKDLYVGNIIYVNEDLPLHDSREGLIVSDNLYLFEKLGEDKYREIFTGFITSEIPDFSYYNKIPYVCGIKEFDNYFPETHNITISKINLLISLNYLNKTEIIKKEENKHILKKILKPQK